VRRRRGEAEPGQEPQHPARAGQRHRVDLGRTDLFGGLGHPGQQGVTDAAAPGGLTDVHRLDGDRHLVGEQAGAHHPGQDEALDLAVQLPDQRDGTGLDGEGADLVAQPLGVVGAQLGAEQRLGAGGQTEVDDRVDVLRTGRAYDRC